jgi:hypothetical protein
VFTARYALSPYIKQTRFVFKGLNKHEVLPVPKLQAKKKNGAEYTVSSRSAAFQANTLFMHVI